MHESTVNQKRFEKDPLIRVGVSTRHGMADEIAACPPDGVEYCFPTPTRTRHRFIRSPIKSYLMEFADTREFDVLEAVLSPVITSAPWVCSLDCFEAALAFGFLTFPLPRVTRVGYVNRLFRRNNCKKLLFWSQAARETLYGYGGVTDPVVIDKATVVYPAIRQVSEDFIRYTDDQVKLLFSGDFFRKGGANVVDVFESLQQEYPGITLRICCDEKIDFRSRNRELKEEYLTRIRKNQSIQFGRVSRQRMLGEVLPETDVYLLPTYNEAFGFAILEAMAYGIPVVATNHFAIPEIIDSESDSFLIDISDFDTKNMFRGYAVDAIPLPFRNHVNDQLKAYLRRLIESSALRRTVGAAALEKVRSKFGFGSRNETMSVIYREAVC
ncbi:D-inositol-3-phosphate glycosyltransferase [Novipirellula aureliae]|uniref:D-inositol-3-phosphate glycosyltransferase n=1 Tax=Novipirellula aureliae TaxID=2527966 RepID=A0A5C6E691_9BACT|nr:glycosyltransferase family 4 protein [Novipirellula aureliae]TWU44348.1 D-inositol-3-phosphate glycosyltransferase [Novipirellula aureliae]